MPDLETTCKLCRGSFLNTEAQPTRKYCPTCRGLFAAAAESGVNMFEALARQAKAKKMAEMLQKNYHATAAQAAALDDLGWAMAAQLAETTVPSAATRVQVVVALTEAWA
jgi:hypothetical protein